MRRLAALAAFSLALALTVAKPGLARADGLTPAESAELARGETVVREATVEQGDRHYVGGVTYTVLDATPGELSALFDDVTAYRHVLPRTKRVRRVGTDHGDTLVELVQGTALYEATYTIRVRRSAREMRFWLEPTMPHEIDDAWGFFRMDPFFGPAGEQRVLVTYGVLVDVGPGIVRELFEERVRAAMLSVPQLVRRYVAR